MLVPSPSFRRLAFRCGLLAIAATMMNSATAAEYIVGSYVLCRDEPAETAAVLGQFTAGDTVSIVERQRKWTKISRASASDEPACWVQSKEVRQPTEYEKYVGHVDSPIRPMYNPTRTAAAAPSAPSASTSYNPPISYVPKASSGNHPRKSAKRPVDRSKRIARSFPSSNYCPCGTGRICTGSRGGRYCITSGGNKRYGV